MAVSNDNSNFRNLLNKLFLRKIQVDIISIFIILLVTSSLIISYFTYSRNYKAIVSISDAMMKQVGSILLEKINDTTVNAELLAQLTKGMIISIRDIANQQQLLSSYLINALKNDPLVYAIDIAMADGSLIFVGNLTLANQSHYYLEPQKTLPQGAKYVIRVIDRTKPVASETWQYLGTDLSILATENVPTFSFDPRTTSWYQGTIAWPRTHWSSVQLIGTQESGIAVSVPVFNLDGKVMAVVNANLSLEQLSNFITHQEITKSGKAFVLDGTGNILIPTPNERPTAIQQISRSIIEEGFGEYSKTEQQQMFLKYNSVPYLLYFTDFPLTLEKQWTIAIIVPFDDFFGAFNKIQRETMLISLGIVALFGVLVYISSKYIADPIEDLAKEVDMISNFDFEDKPPIMSNIKEIVTLSRSIKSMRIALRSFTRYVPKGIVKNLIRQGGQELGLGGERRELTVMFCDIENFTTKSESLPIEELMTSLSAYFDALSKIIVDSEGTIDKFIGDCIMAFWGAPHDVKDHADKACIACLNCIKAIERQTVEKKFPSWHTRFGLHSGEAIVGNIGTTERVNYTAIGNTTNTASRLQSLNKEYETSLLISQTVQEKIGTRFVTRPLDFVAVKGRVNRFTIYELAGTLEGELAASPEQKDLCKAFTEAYGFFIEGKLEKAKTLFSAIAEKFPSDYPTKLYLERIKSSEKKS